MRPAEREPDGEACSAPDLALDADRPAMQIDQFMNQHKADTATFVAARPLPLDPVEALEYQRQFVLGNPDSGVDDRKLDLSVPDGLRNRQHALEGEFESIGEKVENDFVPHVPIDIDRFGKRRAIDDEQQS